MTQARIVAVRDDVAAATGECADRDTPATNLSWTRFGNILNVTSRAPAILSARTILSRLDHFSYHTARDIHIIH